MMEEPNDEVFTERVDDDVVVYDGESQTAYCVSAETWDKAIEGRSRREALKGILAVGVGVISVAVPAPAAAASTGVCPVGVIQHPNATCFASGPVGGGGALAAPTMPGFSTLCPLINLNPFITNCYVTVSNAVICAGPSCLRAGQGCTVGVAGCCAGTGCCVLVARQAECSQ